MVQRLRFQLGCYELETNFLAMDDAMGVEDFLLGRNFLRAYQVLVDLTSMKIVVRAPVQPVWHHAHTQVGDRRIRQPPSAAPLRTYGCESLGGHCQPGATSVSERSVECRHCGRVTTECSIFRGLRCHCQ